MFSTFFPEKKLKKRNLSFNVKSKLVQKWRSRPRASGPANARLSHTLVRLILYSLSIKAGDQNYKSALIIIT